IPPPASCARLPAPNQVCARCTSIAAPQSLPVCATRPMIHATPFPPLAICLPPQGFHPNPGERIIFADSHLLLVCATRTTIPATWLPLPDISLERGAPGPGCTTFQNFPDYLHPTVCVESKGPP